MASMSKSLVLSESPFESEAPYPRSRPWFRLRLSRRDDLSGFSSFSEFLGAVLVARFSRLLGALLTFSFGYFSPTESHLAPLMPGSPATVAGKVVAPEPAAIVASSTWYNAKSDGICARSGGAFDVAACDDMEEFVQRRVEWRWIEMHDAELFVITTAMKQRAWLVIQA